MIFEAPIQAPDGTYGRWSHVKVSCVEGFQVFGLGIILGGSDDRLSCANREWFIPPHGIKCVADNEGELNLM